MRQNAQVVNVLLSAVLATAGSLFAPIVRPLVAQLPPTPPSSEPAPTLPNIGTPAPIYPSCPPPSGGEYLLLVVSKTPDVQERVRRSLPPSASPILCNYLSDVVTRVGGFTTVDSASAWAKYLTDTAGLSAFVARPSDAPPISAAPPQTPTTPQAPSQAPSASAPPQPTAAPQQTAARTSSRYNPQPLGAGFAVLVDFFSRPELAGQIQQILGKDVGLVSYGQRPYLLAIYTGDQTTANSILQTLTDRGFWTMVVDSRRVTLLRPAVSLTGSIVQN